MSANVARYSTTRARQTGPWVLVVTALLSFAEAQSAHAQYTFQPQTQIAAGIRPLAVAIGDLNGDASPDLAVGNAGPSKMLAPGWFRDSCYVSVLLGNGNGTFGPKTDYVTESAPRTIAIGDLNADGLPDVAVAHFNTINVSVHHNLGGGALGPLSAYAAGSLPMGVAIGDFDLDARPDLAVVKSSGSTAVMLGAGDGSFGPKEDFAPGGWSVAIGDLNGDFEPDIATAAYSANAVSILFNTPSALSRPDRWVGRHARAVFPARSGIAQTIESPLTDH